MKGFSGEVTLVYLIEIFAYHLILDEQQYFFAQYAYECKKLLASISINLRKGSDAFKINSAMLADSNYFYRGHRVPITKYNQVPYNF